MVSCEDQEHVECLRKFWVTSASTAALLNALTVAAAQQLDQRLPQATCLSPEAQGSAGPNEAPGGRDPGGHPQIQVHPPPAAATGAAVERSITCQMQSAARQRLAMVVHAWRPTAPAAACEAALRGARCCSNGTGSSPAMDCDGSSSSGANRSLSPGGRQVPGSAQPVAPNPKPGSRARLLQPPEEGPGPPTGSEAAQPPSAGEGEAAAAVSHALTTVHQGPNCMRDAVAGAARVPPPPPPPQSALLAQAAAGDASVAHGASPAAPGEAVLAQPTGTAAAAALAGAGGASSPGAVGHAATCQVLPDGSSTSAAAAAAPQQDVGPEADLAAAGAAIVAAGGEASVPWDVRLLMEASARYLPHQEAAAVRTLLLHLHFMRLQALAATQQHQQGTLIQPRQACPDPHATGCAEGTGARASTPEAPAGPGPGSGGGSACSCGCGGSSHSGLVQWLGCEAGAAALAGLQQQCRLLLQAIAALLHGAVEDIRLMAPAQAEALAMALALQPLQQRAPAATGSRSPSRGGGSGSPAGTPGLLPTGRAAASGQQPAELLKQANGKAVGWRAGAGNGGRGGNCGAALGQWAQQLRWQVLPAALLDLQLLHNCLLADLLLQWPSSPTAATTPAPAAAAVATAAAAAPQQQGQQEAPLCRSSSSAASATTSRHINAPGSPAYPQAHPPLPTVPPQGNCGTRGSSGRPAATSAASSATPGGGSLAASPRASPGPTTNPHQHMPAHRQPAECKPGEELAPGAQSAANPGTLADNANAASPAVTAALNAPLLHAAEAAVCLHAAEAAVCRAAAREGTLPPSTTAALEARPEAVAGSSAPAPGASCVPTPAAAKARMATADGPTLKEGDGLVVVVSLGVSAGSVGAAAPVAAPATRGSAALQQQFQQQQHHHHHQGMSPSPTPSPPTSPRAAPAPPCSPKLPPLARAASPQSPRNHQALPGPGPAADAAAAGRASPGPVTAPAATLELSTSLASLCNYLAYALDLAMAGPQRATPNAGNGAGSCQAVAAAGEAIAAAAGTGEGEPRRSGQQLLHLQQQRQQQRQQQKTVAMQLQLQQPGAHIVGPQAVAAALQESLASHKATDGHGSSAGDRSNGSSSLHRSAAADSGGGGNGPLLRHAASGGGSSAGRQPGSSRRSGGSGEQAVAAAPHGHQQWEVRQQDATRARTHVHVQNADRQSAEAAGQYAPSTALSSPGAGGQATAAAAAENTAATGVVAACVTAPLSPVSGRGTSATANSTGRSSGGSSHKRQAEPLLDLAEAAAEPRPPAARRQRLGALSLGPAEAAALAAAAAAAGSAVAAASGAACSPTDAGQAAYGAQRAPLPEAPGSPPALARLEDLISAAGAATHGSPPLHVNPQPFFDMEGALLRGDVLQVACTVIRALGVRGGAMRAARALPTDVALRLLASFASAARALQAADAGHAAAMAAAASAASAAAPQASSTAGHGPAAAAAAAAAAHDAGDAAQQRQLLLRGMELHALHPLVGQARAAAEALLDELIRIHQQAAQQQQVQQLHHMQLQEEALCQQQQQHSGSSGGSASGRPLGRQTRSRRATGTGTGNGLPPAPAQAGASAAATAAAPDATAMVSGVQVQAPVGDAGGVRATAGLAKGGKHQQHNQQQVAAAPLAGHHQLLPGVLSLNGRMPRSGNAPNTGGAPQIQLFATAACGTATAVAQQQPAPTGSEQDWAAGRQGHDRHTGGATATATAAAASGSSTLPGAASPASPAPGPSSAPALALGRAPQESAPGVHARSCHVGAHAGAGHHAEGRLRGRRVGGHRAGAAVSGRTAVLMLLPGGYEDDGFDGDREDAGSSSGDDSPQPQRRRLYGIAGGGGGGSEGAKRPVAGWLNGGAVYGGDSGPAAAVTTPAATALGHWAAFCVEGEAPGLAEEQDAAGPRQNGCAGGDLSAAALTLAPTLTATGAARNPGCPAPLLPPDVDGSSGEQMRQQQAEAAHDEAATAVVAPGDASGGASAGSSRSAAWHRWQVPGSSAVAAAVAGVLSAQQLALCQMEEEEEQQPPTAAAAAAGACMAEGAKADGSSGGGGSKRPRSAGGGGEGSQAPAAAVPCPGSHQLARGSPQQQHQPGPGAPQPVLDTDVAMTSLACCPSRSTKTPSGQPSKGSSGRSSKAPSDRSCKAISPDQPSPAAIGVPEAMTPEQLQLLQQLWLQQCTGAMAAAASGSSAVSNVGAGSAQGLTAAAAPAVGPDPSALTAAVFFGAADALLRQLQPMQLGAAVPATATAAAAAARQVLLLGGGNGGWRGGAGEGGEASATAPQQHHHHHTPPAPKPG